MGGVLVGIPVYKQSLSYFEQIALAQAKKKLSNYKIMFIAPESLRIEFEDKLDILRFNDNYFLNRETYTELLLTEELYDCILEYEYLLIYQLDAFVFKDALMNFCNMGFDYIGAPLIGGDWKYFHVGNGGLSLRNVKKSLDMVKHKDEIKTKMYSIVNIDYFSEDLFFAYCGFDKSLDFDVPPSGLASTFSVQTDYVRGMRNIHKAGLPFGCHGWYNTNYYFWKPYIEAFGYNLPYIKSTSNFASDNLRRTEYLCRRYLRNKRYMIADDFLINMIKTVNKISIYGAGKCGQICIEFFREIHMLQKVICIYDKSKYGYIEGVPVVKPVGEHIMRKESFIIIATPMYEEEIIDELKTYNLKEKIDFITLTDMMYEDYIFLYKLDR